ncbi:MAG: glycosyltransferase [Proteobacteria bacterium]|nr:glycosyltransferase [Pseudomonadota bacterium]
MTKVCIVVPCFNEVRRLTLGPLRRMTAADVHLILVDDGSTDGTGPKLREFAAVLGGAAQVHALPKNLGKGEAVRHGLCLAIGVGAEIVGYLDADMSTPPEEALRLLSEIGRGNQDAVIGSRVALLGHDIRRSAFRHYFGRVFASAASLAVGLPVYDTQCGAKFFRVDDCFKDCVGDPFASRWAFDVELVGRIVGHPGRGRPAVVEEMPLRVWLDRGSSHLGFLAMLLSGLALIEIRRRLARFRRAR